MPAPRLILCGSLNPLSREQLRWTGIEPRYLPLAEGIADGPAVIATPLPTGDIDDEAAAAMAAQASRAVRRLWAGIGTLIVVGGDTAAALVGDDTLECMGAVAPGIPASRYESVCLVTKGGGIGEPDTLRELMQREHTHDEHRETT